MASRFLDQIPIWPKLAYCSVAPRSSLESRHRPTGGLDGGLQYRYRRVQNLKWGHLTYRLVKEANAQSFAAKRSAQFSDCVFSPVRRPYTMLYKSSSGDEIPERYVTYIVLYDYLFITLPHTCTSGPECFSK